MFIAWVISVIATLSALFIGEIMGKIPCNLCWYQRIFMFPLPIILGIALYRVDFSAWRYALPLSVGGAGIAAFQRFGRADLWVHDNGMEQPALSNQPQS